jgi:hypothetical protein
VIVASAQIDETGLTTKPGLLQVIMNSKAQPGQFAAGINYVTSAAPPSGLAVGDLTGNGSQDVVVANITAGTLAIFTETSPTSGTYNAAVTVTVGGSPNDVQIADINGDGLPDLIVADDTGKVTYLLQNPASPGTFQTGVSLPIVNPAITAEGLPTRAVSVAVGDLSGNGLMDLAVTSFDVNGDYGEVTIYFQNPASPGTYLATPQVIDTYCEPSQIRIADVNQDGAKDLVIACQGLGANANIYADAGTPGALEAAYGAMVILQNSATPGTFGTGNVYVGVSGAVSLVVADLNNDGLPDIAMCSIYPQGEGQIATLTQIAAAPGTFGSLQTIAGSGQPVSIAVADLNNDGFPDLVTADATSAVWYLNSTTSPGVFASEGQIGFAD